MKIAFFRALPLGDMLCAGPALRAVRNAWPEAEVTLIGLPWAVGFAKRFGRYVDDFMAFPGFPGVPGREPALQYLPTFYEQAQQREFDCVFQMHDSGELSNPLAVLLGGRINAGFFREGRYCPNRATYVEWADGEHEVLRMLRLLERLEVPAKGSHLEFPLTEADWNEWRALGLDNYVCIHPGPEGWPAERFADVADALAMEGRRVVLSGTAGDAARTREVASNMREPALDLAGRLTLGGRAALIGRARLLVTGDAGVAQIAAAMRTPSVVLSASDAASWAPLDHRLHRVLHHGEAAGISTPQVLGEIQDLAQCAA